RPGDFAAGERADRALTLVRVVHDQRLLQEMLAHFAAELRFVDLDLVDLVAGLVENRDFDHDRNLALVYLLSCGVRAVMLLRTKRSVPFGPGSAPLMSSRLLATSTFTSG